MTSAIRHSSRPFSRHGRIEFLRVGIIGLLSTDVGYAFVDREKELSGGEDGVGVSVDAVLSLKMTL